MKKIIKSLFVLGIILFAGFAINAEASNYTKKYDFLGGPNGNSLASTLTLKDGKFYGVASGGNNGLGIIFEWDPVTNIYTKKYQFTGGLNGSIPNTKLVLKDEKFYGTTYYGGSTPYGVIFEWDPETNSYTKKVDLSSHIYSDLTLKDGKFYGMNSGGVVNTKGVIFEWDPVTNIYTKKYQFTGGLNGSSPVGSLALKGSKLYGITYSGGKYNKGVIFEWNPVTNIYIKKNDLLGGMNGSRPSPRGTFVLKDGIFYGMTIEGGKYDKGVIFEWNPVTNVYTKKVDFNGNNGKNPYGLLTLNDGKFYGVTIRGGQYDKGVIFEWDPVKNIYTKEYDFVNNISGVTPLDSLALKDGKLYGGTSKVYLSSLGVIFEFDPSDTALNLPPVVKDVNISGIPAVGNTLTGNYTYSDADGDLEGISTYKWFRENVAISGATSINYTTTPEDANKFISFEVTPVSITGTSPGVPVRAEIFVKENTGNSCSITTEPFIMVGYPNGGEGFLIGDEVKAKWRTCNIPSSHNLFVGIMYQGPNSDKEVVTTTVSGTTEETTLVIPNSESFFATNSMRFGQYYYLLVRDLDGGTYAGKDYSDEPFSINSPRKPENTIVSVKEILKNDLIEADVSLIIKE